MGTAWIGASCWSSRTFWWSATSQSTTAPGCAASSISSRPWCCCAPRALLEACPHLTESQARDQWNAIRRRAWQPRQEPFLRVETLLSHGLLFLLDPHRFGGGNIDRVPPEVTVLAASVKRPPGSLTSKTLNLDGSRKNPAPEEPELFIRLQEPGRFERLHRRVLKAARGAGLSEAEVPGFMGALDQDDAADLLGQEELGSSGAAAAPRGRACLSAWVGSGGEQRERSRPRSPPSRSDLPLL